MRRWFVFLSSLVVTFVLGVHINLHFISQTIQEAFQNKFDVTVIDVNVHYRTDLNATIIDIKLAQSIDDATALSKTLDELKSKIEGQGIDKGKIIGWTIIFDSTEQVFGETFKDVHKKEETAKEEKARTVFAPLLQSKSFSKSRMSQAQVLPSFPKKRTKSSTQLSLAWLTPQQVEGIIKEMKRVAKIFKIKQPFVFPYKLYSTTPNDIVREKGMPLNVHTNGEYLYYLYVASNGSGGSVFVFNGQRLILMLDVVVPLTDEILAFLTDIHCTTLNHFYGFPQMYVAQVVSGKTNVMPPGEIIYKLKYHMIKNFIISWFDKTLKGIMLWGGKYPFGYLMVIHGNLEWLLKNFTMLWNDVYKLADSLLRKVYP